MNEKMNDALNQISDKHLQEAIRPKKRKKFYWLGAIAAVLAVVIFLNSGGGAPVASAAGLIVSPEYPQMAPYPEDPNGAYGTAEHDQWSAGLKNQYDQPKGYADGLDKFFVRSIPKFLSESADNAVCSPLNIYMALAMLAETTAGDSREAVLSTLGADSLESLRTQAGHVWNAHYRADGSGASLLANSLWLDEGYRFNRATVNTLAEQYYTSVYQGDLGSAEMDNSLRYWLSQQTHGLLDNYINNISLPEDTALTLASTVFFQARWRGENRFWENGNSEDIFHSPSGDTVCTFMNQIMTYGPYYYGEDYGAVYLDLDCSGGMWLILPDVGYDPRDILKSGHVLNMVLGLEPKNYTSIKVHLSVPKFDICAETDLTDALSDLGLGDLYDPAAADFTAILPDAEGVHLGKTSHAARVAIDEEGVTAAAYTMIAYAGAPVPPEEEVYFTLDRPFLFVITSTDGLPLFAGVVNNP